ncbi:metabotropic glutamate receptor-like [Lasioglossum baleicum]|uniref:metabotropic glutamate receptor-like n=1 Tax=Lasioglossum baleicum TaxID=434251 RepID=UPI003FCD38EB
MKLLLVLLLGVVCSADYEPRDKWLSVLSRSRDDPDLETDLDLEQSSHLARSPRNFYPHVDEIVENDERTHQRSLQSFFRYENPETHHPIRHGRRQFRSMDLKSHSQVAWPVKKEAVVEGDLVLGGLMMVHEREDSFTCGPVMPQGGVQALEAMLYTLDKLNEGEGIVPGVKIGAHILDDCDKDTYGLEMAVDFIKGEYRISLPESLLCASGGVG